MNFQKNFILEKEQKYRKKRSEYAMINQRKSNVRKKQGLNIK